MERTFIRRLRTWYRFKTRLIMNEKINNIEQICSIKRLKYISGRAKDIEILLVNNGVITFELLVDKCLDIGALYHKGTNISFLTAGGLNSAEKEFDANFNGGFLYTCGLDTIGGRAMPIHGRIHNIPAEVIKAEVTENGVEIVGIIKQSSLFKEKLTLKRTIKTGVNSSELEVLDEIINDGYLNAEYCIMYHTNFGYPMLDSGVTVTAPITSTVPRTDYAKKVVDGCFVMDEPKADNEETVYFHTVKKGDITVKNEKLNKSVTITYNEEILPYFIEWKSMVSGAYALGIEPATTTLDGDFAKNTIKPKESVKTGIKVKFN